MKKTLLLIASIIICFSLIGCNLKQDSDKKDKEDPIVVDNPKQEEDIFEEEIIYFSNYGSDTVMGSSRKTNINDSFAGLLMDFYLKFKDNKEYEIMEFKFDIKAYAAFNINVKFSTDYDQPRDGRAQIIENLNFNINETKTISLPNPWLIGNRRYPPAYVPYMGFPTIAAMHIYIQYNYGLHRSEMYNYFRRLDDGNDYRLEISNFGYTYKLS